ncbi:MAG: hypothetical protein ABJH98_05000 [Reichenbachiella sp.]|uniref:hypothetical protein n=1 Tax=Reichenbachiella sp. TaxID=2184521 RepID=UPI00329A656B
MALYVLNFSVDTADFQTDFQPEDLTINDMESVIEIVLEQWMEIEDAIPEYDEPDTDESTMTFKKSFDFICIEFDKDSRYISEFLLKSKFSDYTKKLRQQFCPEFIPPPPKA